MDEARAKHDDIERFLRQAVGDPYDRGEALDALLALTGAAAPQADAPEPGLTGSFDPLPPGVEIVEA